MLDIQDTDALLVIDVQNDFCPGGALAVPDGDAVVPRINDLMSKFSVVVFTQDWHPAGHISFASQHDGKQPFESTQVSYGAQTLWPDHCVQGTNGAEFHPDLNVEPAHIVVRKGYRPDVDSYSAFRENDQRTRTGLAGLLRELGVKRVFCTGIATDVCVKFSALDAVEAGFEAVVIADACRGLGADSVAAAWDALAAAGVTRV